jgi:hypothetical protein
MQRGVNTPLLLLGRSQEGGDRDTEAQKVPDSFGKARKGSGAALAICSKHHSTACLVAQTFIIFPGKAGVTRRMNTIPSF